LDNTTPLTVLGALNHPFQRTLLKFLPFSGNSLPGVLNNEAATKGEGKITYDRAITCSEAFRFFIRGNPVTMGN
jgi:hypothetical protein